MHVVLYGEPVTVARISKCYCSTIILHGKYKLPLQCTIQVFINPLFCTQGQDLVTDEGGYAKYSNQQAVQEMLFSAHKRGLAMFLCFLPLNSKSKALLQKLAIKPETSQMVKPQSLFQQGYTVPTSNSRDLELILKLYWAQSGIPVLVLPLMDGSKISALCSTRIGGDVQYLHQLYRANEPEQIVSYQDREANPQRNSPILRSSSSIFMPPEDEKCKVWDELFGCHSFSNMANIICSFSPEELRVPNVHNCTISHSIVSSQYSQEAIAQLLDILAKKGMQDLMSIPNGDGDTPLHLAIRRNHTAVVSTLLNYLPPSSLRIANKRGYTPLHLSARYQHVHWNIRDLLSQHILNTEKAVTSTVCAEDSKISDQKPAAKKLGPAKAGKSLSHSQYLDHLMLKPKAGEEERGNLNSKNTSSDTTKVGTNQCDEVREELPKVQQNEVRRTDLGASHSESHITSDSQASKTSSPLSLFKNETEVEDINNGNTSSKNQCDEVSEELPEVQQTEIRSIDPEPNTTSDSQTCETPSPLPLFKNKTGVDDTSSVTINVKNQCDEVREELPKVQQNEVLGASHSESHITSDSQASKTSSPLSLFKNETEVEDNGDTSSVTFNVKNQCDKVSEELPEVQQAKFRSMDSEPHITSDSQASGIPSPLSCKNETGVEDNGIASTSSVTIKIGKKQCDEVKEEVQQKEFKSIDSEPHSTRDSQASQILPSLTLLVPSLCYPNVVAIKRGMCTASRLTKPSKWSADEDNNIFLIDLLCSSCHTLQFTALSVSGPYTTRSIQAVERVSSSHALTLCTAGVSTEKKVMCTTSKPLLVSHLPEHSSKQPTKSAVKIFIVGDHDAGKSTLLKALENRFSGMQIKATGVDEKTAGIIPLKAKSRFFGRIVLYDFAGQKDFYTYHTAIIQQSMDDSSTIHLTDLQNSDEEFEGSIQSWPSFIDNQCPLDPKPLISTIMHVCSHADEIISTNETAKTKSASFNGFMLQIAIRNSTKCVPSFFETTLTWKPQWCLSIESLASPRSAAVDAGVATLVAEALVSKTGFFSCRNLTFTVCIYAGPMKSQMDTFSVKKVHTIYVSPDDTIYNCRMAQQKPKIFPILHMPHDFIHMTSELHITSPPNSIGDNVLHTAVDLSEETGTAGFKTLLQHNDVDTLIIELNLEGNSPLHKAARLMNPAVFELLLEEACRSYGCVAIEREFPEFFDPKFQRFCSVLTAIIKCECPVDFPAVLQCILNDQWSLKDRNNRDLVSFELYDLLMSKYNQTTHPVLHKLLCKILRGFDLDKKEPEPRQCSDTDFKNASMCHSAAGPYQLYRNQLSTTSTCDCCAHVVQQCIAIPNECSPVPPYLGRKTETLKQGNSDNRHSKHCHSERRREPSGAQASRYGHEKGARPIAQTVFSGHDKMPRDLSKTQQVEADEPVRKPMPQEQELSVHVPHFNLAAECLHAQDYVRMRHSLPYCCICNPFIMSNTRVDDKTQMAYLFGCGLAHMKLSKQKIALKHFQACESIAVKAGLNGDIALCNQNIGDILLAKQSFISAAEHYSKAVDYYSPESVAQKFKMIVPSISGLYSKLASALRNASKLVDAVQAYRNAIAAAESKKDKLSAHTSLGNVYQSVGENASALTEYEHSIKLSEELEDNVSLGWAHGNLGNACLGLYQRDKALHHLDTSLTLALKYEPTPQAIGRAYNNLGTAFQALNEYDKAQENYDLALGQGIYGNDIPGQARVYGNIGNLLMVRQEYDRAIPHYTEVLRLSKDRSTVSTAYHNRGCAFYELAESKKTTIPERRSSNTTFYLHGPESLHRTAEHQPLVLPNSIIKFYRNGSRDLEEVVKFHEETLNSIKGSAKGLTLSVSLFESNSRTFHRLQDCLVSLGEWKKALVVAEQSRTRTLGELLLKKKEWQLKEPLSAPLTLDHITSIVSSQDLPVLYLSYTGARLLGWILVPNSEGMQMGMFEIPMKDDQFNGKSFDYHLRYSLNETLVERSFEMYRSLDYSSEENDPVINLYNLIGKPLCNLLEKLNAPVPQPITQRVLVIPDSYTNLLPFTCLLATNPEMRFLGDQYSFQLMPSLLTMGILNQLPPTTVMIPAESQDMCVVGNPTIPPFTYHGEPWNLGKLPYATKEAQWVAHILRTTPILHEQATKNAVLMRILNSKVIHIATHGSAAAGFLAFAGMSSSRSKEPVDSSSVLLYPRDIEKQNVSPALVVLSSCDSGRGEVKADGIQSMARAFILAGAQAVLTTLWRVPDESASVFMQFFYQYLVDGFCGTEALQKAILSLRSFSKYSQYIHWSGYQLTGREIQFDIRKPDIFKMLETRLGASSVFPRLDDVKKLESALVNDPRMPTDVQVL